jgi:hypothetical protein
MGFVDKLKDTAQKGMDAAQKGMGEAKEKASELSLKRKFNGLAEELGTLVFRQREGELGLQDDIDRVIRDMREVVAQLDADDAA